MKRTRINPISSRHKIELDKRRFLKVQLIIESKGLCMTCGQKGGWLEFLEGLSLSHIIPLSRGGKTTRENCLVECNSCHTKYEKKPELRPEWQLTKYGIREANNVIIQRSVE